MEWYNDSIGKETVRKCKQDKDYEACRKLLSIMRVEPREEQVIGGAGDSRLDGEFDEDQLVKGIRVELEHTDNPYIAKEISKDHLTEEAEVKEISTLESRYYDDLEAMEALWER